MHTLCFLMCLIAAVNPPSGRPPVGPLIRYDPYIYEVKFEVLLNSEVVPDYRGQGDPSVPPQPTYPVIPGIRPEQVRRITGGDTFITRNTPLLVPLIRQTTWHAMDMDSIAGSLWLNQHQVTDLNATSRIEENGPYFSQVAVFPLPAYEGKVIRWNLSWRVQSWDAQLDERGAQNLTWPRQWPPEVQDALRAEKYIESGDEIFSKAVEDASGGNLRLVSPYLAAKDLIRYCLKNIRLSGTGLYQGRSYAIYGFNVKGARETASIGRGTPNDLLCLCIAVLRAAEIPARPVIGIQVLNAQQRRDILTCWGEFYLEGAGWIPFDPVVMLNNGVMNRDINSAWTGIGSFDDLNQRIPLAFEFSPRNAGVESFPPGIWGWGAAPVKLPNYFEQYISFEVTALGVGISD